MESGGLANFPRGEKMLKVTATFGRTDAPADIGLAATILMGALLTKNMKGGDTNSEKVGDVAFTYKAVNEYVRGNYDTQRVMSIYSILDQYRRPTF